MMNETQKEPIKKACHETSDKHKDKDKENGNKDDGS